MVLRANEYKQYIDDLTKYKDRERKEEKYIKEAQDRLKAIRKELKKLDKKLF